MRRVLAVVSLSGCATYGVGASTTSMLGHATSADGAGQLSVEQQTGELTLVGRRGPLVGFLEMGLTSYAVRERRGDAAMEPDDLGLGDRSIVAIGWRLPRAPMELTPYLSYALSLSTSAFGGPVDGELGETELAGGLGAGLEVALAADRLAPYLRIAVEQVHGTVVSGLFATADPAGAPFTATTLAITLGVRVELAR
ncbi:MAG: hypothetical protein R3B06_15570 [Kofleriaceae bacterium]